jgi:hypothetical protein
VAEDTQSQTAQAGITYAGDCKVDDDCPTHRRCLLLKSTDAQGAVQAYGSCVPTDAAAYPSGYPPGTVPP